MTTTVKIHGKEYETVASRVKRFREDHPDMVLDTNLLESGESVRFKATIAIICPATDARPAEILAVATGYAEEVRGSTNINSTSA